MKRLIVIDCGVLKPDASFFIENFLSQDVCGSAGLSQDEASVVTLRDDAEVCTGVSTGRGALENFFLLNLLMLRNEPLILLKPLSIV
jgi:hypothetical protein